MNFNDIFKSSFLENITSVSVVDMLLTLALAFGIGLFIFLVYKKTYSGVMYSSSWKKCQRGRIQQAAGWG